MMAARESNRHPIHCTLIIYPHIAESLTHRAFDIIPWKLNIYCSASKPPSHVKITRECAVTIKSIQKLHFKHLLVCRWRSAWECMRYITANLIAHGSRLIDSRPKCCSLSIGDPFGPWSIDLVYDDHDLELDNLSTDLLDQARLTLDSRDEL